jgi:hypothetical protein
VWSNNFGFILTNNFFFSIIILIYSIVKVTIKGKPPNKYFKMPLRQSVSPILMESMFNSTQLNSSLESSQGEKKTRSKLELEKALRDKADALRPTKFDQQYISGHSSSSSSSEGSTVQAKQLKQLRRSGSKSSLLFDNSGLEFIFVDDCKLVVTFLAMRFRNDKIESDFRDQMFDVRVKAFWTSVDAFMVAFAIMAGLGCVTLWEQAGNTRFPRPPFRREILSSSLLILIGSFKLVMKKSKQIDERRVLKMVEVKLCDLRWVAWIGLVVTQFGLMFIGMNGMRVIIGSGAVDMFKGTQNGNLQEVSE